MEKLIKRLAKGKWEGKISIEQFANFLKSKVAKKRTLDELYDLTRRIDIDNDNYIDYYDLHTCITNLNNQPFFSPELPPSSATGFIIIIILYIIHSFQEWTEKEEISQLRN